MYKRYFYNYLLVIAGLLLAEVSFSQSPSTPRSDYNTLGSIGNSSSGGVVCPSLLPGYPNNNNFHVSAESTDIGDINNNTFEWVVYGGWITNVNGIPVDAFSYTFSRQRTASIRYSYVSNNGVFNPAAPSSDWESYITVEWDTTNHSIVNGWVAVRQTSEYRCSDGQWSIFTNTIQNDPPQFTSTFIDTHLPFDRRLGYTLPLPTTTDNDACNVSYPLFRSVKVENPVGTTIFTGDEAPGNQTANLLQGTNRVTWTAFDGSRSTTQSYNIIVEPLPDILHVSWVDPTCGTVTIPSTSGSAYAHEITNYAFSYPVEYSFDGGTTWGASFASGLAAGSYTVQARIIYGVDLTGDNVADESYTQYSGSYGFTLTASANQSVDGVPDEGPPNATVIDATCLSKKDGIISILSSSMGPTNSSVTFNGSNSYLLLNKYYNGEISSFSVAAWIRTASSSGTIISFDNSEYYHLGISLGRIQLTTKGTLNEDNVITVNNAAYQVNDNKWHLVVATYGASSYNIYIDGVKMITQAAVGSATIGKSSVTRYGMIGALSKTPTFSPSPQGSYFSGQMAGVAVWDGTTLSASDAFSMFTQGGLGGNDLWILNDVPANVSPAHSGLFDDCGNAGSGSEWGRFYNCSLSTSNAPKLYSWEDDPTINSLYRDSLAVGSYTLDVKDLFGCGLATNTYVIENGDPNDPFLLWNAAVAKPANQSSTPNAPNNTANMASDGLYNTVSVTSADNDAWWDVNLSNSFPVKKVIVHANAGISNVYVMVSPSGFSGATVDDDLLHAGIQYRLIPSISGGDAGVADFTIYGNYVRIRVRGAQSLQLSDVEVLTDYRPSTTRKLYLTDNCTYEITGNDVTIDPLAYDGCGGPVVVSDVPATLDSTLIGLNNWGLGPHSVVWTATDEKGLKTNLTMNFNVVDEELPVFVTDPFAGVPSDTTYCAAQTFHFPIPDVTDNYTCEPMKSITLTRDVVWTAYTYPDMATYDHTNPGLVPAIPKDMKPGNHTYVWTVVDFNDNVITRSHTMHIQLQPILSEVKVAPISCSGSNDAAVYFSKVTSEPAATVDYILRPVGGGADIVQNSSVFTPVAPGTYKALIGVNGCYSNIYNQDVVISDPSPIDLNSTVTNVRCFGETNGAINLNPGGGSQTNILHLEGGSVSAPNYAALNLTSAGMIECWVFLDSLAPANGMNDDASLFGVGASYGLRMVNSVLTFYAGSASVAAGAGAIVQRTWTHIAGAFTWNGTNGSLTLYIGGSSVASVALVANPSIPVGGSVYMGAMNGFIRNARIWNAFPAYFGDNMRLVSPIDPGSNLVANFPVNESGGSSVTNFTAGSGGTIGGSYNHQRFAFYWLDHLGAFLTFDQNITAKPTGAYSVTLYDPLGCTSSFNDTIKMDDKDPPTMTFFSDHGRVTTPLGVGLPIIRYTNDVSGGGNVAGDCYYFPYAKEFDPRVDDGVCPAAAVVLSFVPAVGSDGWGVPAPVGGEQSLDGLGMTGIITLDWTATDPNGLTATQTVTYYAVDNENPAGLTLADASRNTNPATCDFTVPVGDLIPVITDNCGNGRLYNNLNNSNNIDGMVFAPGVHPILWTYEDRVFPGETPTVPRTLNFTLTVVDNQLPTTSCKPPFNVYLDDYGAASIDFLNLDAGSSDNCGHIAAYRLSKNIANTGAATQSTTDATVCSGVDTGTPDKAIDNNTNGVFAGCSSTLTTLSTDPWWQVNFGSSQSLYGVNLYNSAAAPLTGFWLLVSTNGVFNHTGSWAAPVFSADVTYSQWFPGTVSGSQLFAFNHVVTGQYVRVQMVSASAQLSLAEVEVYGTNAPSSTLALTCADVRFTAPATFSPIGVMLTVIDDGNNSASCITNVTVIDDIKPTVITKNHTYSPDASGNVAIDPADLLDAVLSRDNCAIDYTKTYTVPATLHCADAGSNNVELHVVDIHGLETWEYAVVNVVDNVLPVVNARAAVDIPLDDLGTYTITNPQALLDLGSTDNCGSIVLYSVTPNTFNCAQVNTSINLTYTVTDAAGNVSNPWTVVATVRDNTPPTATIQNFNLTLKKTGASIIYFTDFGSAGYDNCGLQQTGLYFDNDVIGNMCPAGHEDEGAVPPTVLPIDDNGTLTPTNENLSPAYPVTYANDAGGTGTAYVTLYTAANTDRWLYLSFGANEYYIDNSTVYWGDQPDAPTPTIISHPPNNPGKAGSPSYAGFPIAGLNDNKLIGADYSGCYITSVVGTISAVDYEYNVSYDFGAGGYTFTQVNVRWFTKGNPAPRVVLPNIALVEFSNDNITYTNQQALTLNAGNNITPIATPIYARYVRVRFGLNVNNRYGGIEEFYVWGYSGPRQYNTNVPTSATIQYRNTVSGVGWTNFGATGTVGVNYPAGNNVSTVLPIKLATDMRISLRNNASAGYLSVLDWIVNGYAKNSVSNCRSWHCSDVPTSPHTAHVVYVSNTGQTTVQDKVFQVLPYFTIDDIQVKDCAVTGEQYWSYVTNNPDNYQYTWTDITPGNHSCILTDGIGSNNCQASKTWSSTTQTIAQLRVSNPPAIANGTYNMRLNITDMAVGQSGCTLTRDLTFTATDDLDISRSVEWDTVCVGEDQTFTMALAVANTYYGSGGVGTCDNGNPCIGQTFTWVYPPGYLVSGGGSTDPTVTLHFPTAGNYDAQCGVSGNQRYVLYGNDNNNNRTAFPTVVPIMPMSTTMNCSAAAPCFDFGTNFTGPFNFDVPSTIKITNNAAYPVGGKNVVHISPRDQFNNMSYYLICDEGKTYHVNVEDVIPPDITGTTTVCPFTQYTYSVPAVPAFFNYDWETPGARKISGGNGSDLYVTVEWNMDNYPTTTPKVKLTVTNKHGCIGSKELAITYHGASDASGITVNCPAVINQDATVGSCSYTFPHLNPPTVSMNDGCPYKSLEFFDGSTWKTDATGTYTLGTHAINWVAKDYFWTAGSPAGHISTCTQTININDGERPTFDVTPQNITLQTAALATTCDIVFPDNSRDVTAHDAPASAPCTPDGSLVYKCWLDYGQTGTFVNSPLANKRTIQGITFPVGKTEVRDTVYDLYGNYRDASFVVTVNDNTNPVFNAVTSITTTSDLNKDYASYASLLVLGLAQPQVDLAHPTQFTDNCSNSAYLNSHVTLVSRSDGGNDITKDYPRGNTILTWRVIDANNNYSEQTQTITVNDAQPPWFLPLTDADLHNGGLSITYCDRLGYRLDIPTPYDNYQVNRIDYTVKNSVGTTIQSGFITRAQSVNFDPYGTDKTAPFDITGVDAANGSNYTVTWNATDVDNNKSIDYSYTLHVEIEPVFSVITTNPMTCGGADDGSIVINTTVGNTAGYHYERTHSPEFTVDNGVHWGSPDQTTFAGLRGNTYTVKMRVNGCVSTFSQSTTITAPTAYTLSATKTDVLCYESKTGTMTLHMGGGAPGQLHFGSSISAPTYSQIDLTTQGSLGGWVYLDNLSDGTLMTKGGAYSLSFTGGQFVMTAGGVSATSSITAVAQRWYYVVGSWNSGGTQIIVDGNSFAGSAASAPSNGGSFTMGGFSGILRDVNVWNTVIGGGAPGSPYTGNEAGLVGYWQLNDGAGNTAYNKCKVNGWGENATGASGLWNSTLPQPGSYTWNKDGSWYSSDINLANLGIGRYTALFVDPYGCPNPVTHPLTATDSIEATDKIAPVISAIGALSVNADPNSCTYTVDDMGEVAALTPTIVDASGCKFDVSWRVVTDYNQAVFTNTGDDVLDNKIFNAVLGRSRLNGLNTVTVTTLQNKDVTSTKTYTITVNDREKPFPDGRFNEVLNLAVNQYGKVQYSALQFNRNSSDNCSDPDEMTYWIRTNSAQPWSDSVNIDCSHIGESVQISFKVVDEAGNADSLTDNVNNFTIVDITPPEILKNSVVLPNYCATVDANGGIPAYTPISLKDFELFAGIPTLDYRDNCGVTRIRYKQQHSTYNDPNNGIWHVVPGMVFDPSIMMNFYQGTTTVTFEVADGDDVLGRRTFTKDLYTVIVLPKPVPGGGTGIQ